MVTTMSELKEWIACKDCVFAKMSRSDLVCMLHAPRLFANPYAKPPYVALYPPVDKESGGCGDGQKQVILN